ncbi:MAG: RNA pseudouridine synthase [Kordiimonadaceae bacterium]|jgi:tRNA pseudouridine32 synthase / 23S rRNA pseudouridine746 synthase|nr:RNA pseudouridine synthase [Kordiimonadaceae bacterium]MBT6031929.1 RNA pseudouridine synthase [Kordiimonadaceae bacterium]
MIKNYNPPLIPFLDIIYSDADIVVLNKPSGLLSVPGRDPKHRDSLITRVQEENNSALIVHRLDMDTSGLIILALNKETHRHLSIQFQDRKVQKEYIARVYGTPEQNEGIIDLPLICDWPNRPKQIVDYDVGKPSQTKWRVIEKRTLETRLLLTPITGRSHQLRVHLQNINHPILGDRFYAHEKALQMSERLCLHATSLTVMHPKTLDTMTFISDPEF